MRKAIFFDRDGTLNEEAHYLRAPAQVRLLPTAARAVRLVNEAGWLALVLTNQSGIARGYLDEAGLHAIHTELQRQMQAEGARLDAFYFCPHLPWADDEASATIAPELLRYRVACACRKPQAGMLQHAAREWQLDLAACAVIGDRASDVAAAHAVGAASALVLTGYGAQELTTRAGWARPPTFVAATLEEAVRLCLPTSK